jgi:hypothetical protein
MDIERVNAVLVKAIVGLQSGEIEGMTEAVEAKVKKLSVAMVKRALKTENFSLGYRDKSWFRRDAEPSPGIMVIEWKFNGKPARREYSAQAYRGTDAHQRWESIRRTPELKQAVAWANEYAQEAADFVAAETG